MSHIMETGFRRTAAGELVPRDIITSFTCRYNGTEIFRADLFPAIAANPFISFFTVATESGKFEFEWIGDNGFSLDGFGVDHGRMSLVARDSGGRAARARLPSSPAKFRRTSAAPAMPSWGRTPRRCRTTTPPIPACCSCSTAKRSGSQKLGSAGKACADCHGDARESMKGVAARYPAFDKALGPPGQPRAAHQSGARAAPGGAAVRL